MILEKIGIYEISKVTKNNKEIFLVDNGKYKLTKAKKFVLNKKHKILNFDTYDDAKDYVKKQITKFRKRKETILKKIPKSLYLVIIKENKTNIKFVKVGFTSKRYIFRRFAKEYGYDGYELIEVLRKIDSDKSEILEEKIKNELKNRSIKKYRPILENFSGYSECFDIINISTIKEIFDNIVKTI